MFAKRDHRNQLSEGNLIYAGLRVCKAQVEYSPCKQTRTSPIQLHGDLNNTNVDDLVMESLRCYYGNGNENVTKQ